MKIEEQEWKAYKTDKRCPECYGPVVVMVNNKNIADFFMCEECNFSYGGDIHGVKQ